MKHRSVAALVGLVIGVGCGGVARAQAVPAARAPSLPAPLPSAAGTFGGTIERFQTFGGMAVILA